MDHMVVGKVVDMEMAGADVDDNCIHSAVLGGCSHNFSGKGTRLPPHPRIWGRSVG